MLLGLPIGKRLYYQQTAEGLEESERVKAWEIQQIALAHSYDWSTMFQAWRQWGQLAKCPLFGNLKSVDQNPSSLRIPINTDFRMSLST